jgi:acid-sensing ion channel, other
MATKLRKLLKRKRKEMKKSRIREQSTSTLRGFLSDYMENTSIHGLKYIGETNRSWFERIWWCLVLLVSALLCGAAIWQQMIKWEQNPVIVTFAERPTPIWQIPFPAVTICPNAKAAKTVIDLKKVYRYFVVDKKSLYNLSAGTIEKILALSQVCGPAVFEDIDPENQTNCAKCEETLWTMRPKKEQFCFSCTYIGETNDCQDFEEVLTDEGVCYTYNGLYRYNGTAENFISSTDHWTLDEGYVTTSLKKDRKHVYPRRALGSGMEFGIHVMLVQLIRDMDEFCRGPYQGFKVVFRFFFSLFL